MSNYRIALINLNSLPNIETRGVYPVGLTCLESHLNSIGIDTKIVDFLAEPDQYETFSFLNDSFDFIGFSIRNLSTDKLYGKSLIYIYRDFIKRVLGISQNINQRTKYILGGAGYSVYYKAIKDILPYDIGIVGPGEYDLTKVICSCELESTSKICKSSKANDNLFKDIKFNYNKKLVKSYLKDGFRQIGLPTVRGKCPYNCIYCSYKFSESSVLVSRNIDLIREEIVSLYEMGVRRIFFTDSVFNLNLEHAKKVCRMLIDLNIKDLFWTAYIVPVADEELIQLMAKSNCSRVAVSFDTFSETMLDNLNKGFTIGQVNNFIGFCRKYNLPIDAFVLFGGPGENINTVKETCDYVNKYLYKDEFYMGFGLRIYPESNLANIAGICSDDLLMSTFWPFDEKVFEWVLDSLDNRFLTFTNVSEVIKLQKTYKSLKQINIGQYPGKILVLQQ